jgi:hypothetical protein
LISYYPEKDKKRLKGDRLKLPIFVISSFLSANLWGADLYVAIDGNNKNDGSKNAPFQTILKASQVAKPGSTVHVGPGRYSGGFQTKAEGRADAPIVYVSDSKWKAVLIPPSSSSREMGWDNRGHYVTIKDFLVDGAIDPSSGPMWTVGINVGGTGNKVIGCYVKNIYLKGDPNSGGGAGILLDSYYGFNDMHALNNVVTNIGPNSSFYQGIYMTATGSIKNNIVFGVKGGAGIHLWHDARNIDVINNTSVGNNGGIILGGGDFIRAKTPADYFNVQNNIVYGNIYGINQLGSNGTHNVYKNNLVFQNTYNFYNDFSRGKASHSGTVSADPKFVKYVLSESGDFSLQKGSPAIDKGLSNSLAPELDYNGLKRPQGSSVDIGAFEYKQVADNSPLASVSASALNFSDTNVGSQSVAQVVTISSASSAPLLLLSVKVSAADFVVSGGSCVMNKAYALGEKCTLNVSFTPKQANARSAVLAIENNSSSSMINVSLKGSGVAIAQPKPMVSLSLSSFNFGSVKVNNVSSSRTVTITNSGNAPLIFTQYFKFSGAFGFAGTGTCKINVAYAPGKSCTASMAFKPRAIGQQSGSLSILSNASSTSVVLRGNGIK